MIKQITPDILYIGTDDPILGRFDNHLLTPDGMAYNSYLILDEKVAVLDTTDRYTQKSWEDNLLTALKGRTPDYLVVHHMEPDHSSHIDWVLERFPSVKVVATAKTLQMIPQFFPEADLEGRGVPVKEGDEISLGRHSLRFFMAPMVHWPEVMVSFEPSTGILFAADAFGKFGALGKCGYTSDEETDWLPEARRYYLNICGKYGGPVQTLLKKAASLPIKTICSLHGPILKGDLSEYIRLYNLWSRYEPEKAEGVFVPFASMHGGTQAVAERFVDILRSRGTEAVTFDLANGDPAQAVALAFVYGRTVLAACSYDAGLFTPALHFILDLQSKAWQNRKVGLIENGSWAPSAGRIMREMFSGMKGIELVEPLVSIRSRLKSQDIPALEALADSIIA